MFVTNVYYQLKQFHWRSLLYGRLMRKILRHGFAHLFMLLLVIPMILFWGTLFLFCVTSSDCAILHIWGFPRACFWLIKRDSIDVSFRLCQDIVMLKAEVAELLLPNVVVNLAGRKNLDIDLCRIISLQVIYSQTIMFNLSAFVLFLFLTVKFNLVHISLSSFRKYNVRYMD